MGHTHNITILLIIRGCMPEFDLQIWVFCRWLTKGRFSSPFKFKFNRSTQIILLFGAQRASDPAPFGKIQKTMDVSTYHITAAKCRGRRRSVFWCLLNKAAWDCSPSPCGLSSGCKESESLTAHQASPPRGPGTGRGRLTNCKGFNWAAHKLFSPQKDWLQQMS